MARPSIDLELRPKAIAVHDRLCAEYSCPIPYFHSLDPLSELVSSLLSHRTKNRDSGRAFKQLVAQFPTPACDRCVVLDLCPYGKARQDLVQP